MRPNIASKTRTTQNNKRVHAYCCTVKYGGSSLSFSNLNDVVGQGLGAVEQVHPVLGLLSVHREVELVRVLHGRLQLEGLHAVLFLAVVASSKHYQTAAAEQQQ